MSFAQRSAHRNRAEKQFPASGVEPVATIVPVTSLDNFKDVRRQVRPVSVELAEVMFTGRVPVSTWTFAISVENKLWVSGPTTLYFGKCFDLNKTLYQKDILVADNRIDMEIEITAYNGYGDVLCASESLRAYSVKEQSTTSKLVRLEEDWTQLLLKFNVNVAK